MSCHRTIPALFLTAATLAAAGAAGFQKAYFAATKPGAWAKYAMTLDGKTESTYLYSRLPDEKGHVRIQIRTDFTSGANKGTWSVSDYRLKTGYSIEDDALDYGRSIESLTMQAKGSKRIKMTASMLKAMLKDMPDYAKSAVFAATETVNGKVCDGYKYTQQHPGNPEQIETGELWFNETVPFGLVRQRATFKETSGKPLPGYEMNLQSSGVKDAAPVKAAPSKK